MKNIGDILNNLKYKSIYVDQVSELEDNQILHTTSLIEEFDDIYELFFEIEIIMYNDYLKSYDDITSIDYINSLSDYYLIDNNYNKVFFTDLIQYIYPSPDPEENCRMYGDDKFIDAELIDYEDIKCPNCGFYVSTELDECNQCDQQLY